MKSSREQIQTRLKKEFFRTMVEAKADRKTRAASKNASVWVRSDLESDRHTRKRQRRHLSLARAIVHGKTFQQVESSTAYNDYTQRRQILKMIEEDTPEGDKRLQRWLYNNVTWDHIEASVGDRPFRLVYTKHRRDCFKDASYSAMRQMAHALRAGWGSKHNHWVIATKTALTNWKHCCNMVEKLTKELEGLENDIES